MYLVSMGIGMGIGFSLMGVGLMIVLAYAAGLIK